MQTPLLTSKLTPPAVSRYSVDRTEICAQVFLAFSTKVVLIRAPAGFGKTTVMAQLFNRYRNEGTAVAWLNLDEADNDLPRFLSYLLVALKQHLAGDPTLGGIESERFSDTGYVTTLLAHQLGERETPFVLFLDELDVIRDPSVLAFIKQMAGRLPHSTRLVVGSRTFPEIGLAKMRARGDLFEVTPEQLRFSADEARLFLTERRGLALGPEQVTRLLRSTEGWATALWLASVALERRVDSDGLMSGFAGSATAIAEYLAEDVMAGLPAPTREFLLQTSVLTELDASLCDAVCARTDSAEVLHQLERGSLFLSIVDEQRTVYRYHSLFRDFLRAQLAKQSADSIPILHRKAAQWFLAAGRPIPAVEHALLTGDLTFAMPLLEQQAGTLLNQGRLRLLTRWLETFPAALLQSPHLRLLHIWAVNLTRGSQEALTLIERIDPADLLEEADRAQYHAMQPTLLAMRDRIDESFALGLDRIQGIRETHKFPFAILAQTLAVDSMILGQFAEARRYVDRAHAVLSGSQSALQLGLAGSINGAIDLIQGRLRQALAELKLAAGVAEDGLHQNCNRNVLSGVLLAEALYEAGDLSRAERLLGLFVPLAQVLGLPDQLITAHALMARIAEQQRDPDRSLDVLTQLELYGHRLGLPRVIASARVEKSAILLLRGDAATANEQLDRAAEGIDWEQVSRRSFIANDKVTLQIGRLRWMLRSGQAATAVPLIKSALADALAADRLRRALKLRILLAEAYEVDGQHKLAMRTLLKATETSAAEGFVSIYVEEGERIEEMLRGVSNNRRAELGADAEDPLSSYLTRISRPPTAPAAPAAGAPSDALTRKEVQILELLAQGFSNDGMAEKLFISESTVRTHLRSINTKLHASNRMHALAIARQRQLIG